MYAARLGVRNQLDPPTQSPRAPRHPRHASAPSYSRKVRARRPQGQRKKLPTAPVGEPAQRQRHIELDIAKPDSPQPSSSAVCRPTPAFEDTETLGRSSIAVFICAEIGSWTARSPLTCAHSCTIPPRRSAPRLNRPRGSAPLTVGGVGGVLGQQPTTARGQQKLGFQAYKGVLGVLGVRIDRYVAERDISLAFGRVRARGFAGLRPAALAPRLLMNLVSLLITTGPCRGCWDSRPRPWQTPRVGRGFAICDRPVLRETSGANWQSSRSGFVMCGLWALDHNGSHRRPVVFGILSLPGRGRASGGERGRG